jgi:hypothetical protein
MPAFNKFRPFVAALANGTHNLGDNTLKVMLSNNAPNPDWATKSQVTEIAAGGGYPAGGTMVNVSSSAQTAGVYQMIGDDVVFTATGAGFGPFRYAILYNDSALAKPLIGWWDRGASISVQGPDTVTIDFDVTAGVLQIS